MAIQLLIDKLGKNKVTTHIKNNEKYEEKYYYEKIEDKFMLIEDLGKLYKELKTYKNENLKDPFIYAILFDNDPTISLLSVSKKNSEIEKYLSSLPKYEKKELLYEYMSKLQNKYIIIDGKIYGKPNSEKCMILISKEGAYDISYLTIKEYKSLIYKEIALRYDKENLKTKLVSDLKEIAKSLNIATFKVIDDKKKQLLKAELLEAIKDKIAIILSPV
jgi:hypothetical protein